MNLLIALQLPKYKEIELTSQDLGHHFQSFCSKLQNGTVVRRTCLDLIPSIEYHQQKEIMHMKRIRQKLSWELPAILPDQAPEDQQFPIMDEDDLTLTRDSPNDRPNNWRDREVKWKMEGTPEPPFGPGLGRRRLLTNDSPKASHLRIDEPLSARVVRTVPPFIPDTLAPLPVQTTEAPKLWPDSPWRGHRKRRSVRESESETGASEGIEGRLLRDLILGHQRSTPAPELNVTALNLPHPRTPGWEWRYQCKTVSFDEGYPRAIAGYKPACMNGSDVVFTREVWRQAKNRRVNITATWDSNRRVSSKQVTTRTPTTEQTPPSYADTDDERKRIRDMSPEEVAIYIRQQRERERAEASEPTPPPRSQVNIRISRPTSGPTERPQVRPRPRDSQSDTELSGDRNVRGTLSPENATMTMRPKQVTGDPDSPGFVSSTRRPRVGENPKVGPTHRTPRPRNPLDTPVPTICVPVLDLTSNTQQNQTYKSHGPHQGSSEAQTSKKRCWKQTLQRKDQKGLFPCYYLYWKQSDLWYSKECLATWTIGRHRHFTKQLTSLRDGQKFLDEKITRVQDDLISVAKVTLKELNSIWQNVEQTIGYSEKT